MSSLGRDEAAQRLGVVGDADEEEIARALRRRIRSPHPNLGGDGDDPAPLLGTRPLSRARRSEPHALEVVTRRSVHVHRLRRTGAEALARMPLIRDLLVPLRSRRA